MKKFEGMLICTDLDGTLLREDKSISKENSEAIEYFKNEGGLFTFITGRMPNTSVGMYEAVKPNAPIGCINGGGIYDFEKREFCWVAELPREALDLVEYVDKELPWIGIQVNTSKAIYFNKYNRAMEKFRKITGLPDIRCHYREVGEKLAKVVFTEDDEARLIGLMEALHKHPKSDKFDYIRSQSDIYEILPKGISKGTALEKLTEILGLDINKTIAVGDYNNDISMLRKAKAGVAVANALDEVKAAADYVTVSNEEHAIAQIIRDIESGKIKI